MLDQDCDFECPYCGELNSIALDVTGGERQSFVQDCSVCCQPIQISAQFEDGELVSFAVDRQD